MQPQELLERCLFPVQSYVSCAVSGGPDSMALLVLACESGRNVTAIYVDHGLRPSSANDAFIVEQAAKRLGAEFVGKKIALDPGPNLEARARAARYSVLPQGVLTGHTADDQAETVLLNLMRGAGLSGLGAMSSTTRPLLNIRRFETHALCEELGLSIAHDETNDSDRFRRNRVRKELIPLLNDIAERDVAGVIARQTDYLRADEEFLQSLASEIEATDCKQLVAAPQPLAVRAIRNWLRENLDDEMHPPSASAVNRVIQVAYGKAVACEVGRGVTVRRTNQRLYILFKR